jgi:hypothetical protein
MPGGPRFGQVLQRRTGEPGYIGDHADELGDKDQGHSPGKQRNAGPSQRGSLGVRASGSTATTLRGDKILHSI